MRVLIISCFIGVALILPAQSSEKIDWENIINTVNNNNEATWKAGHNFPLNISVSYLRRLQGTILQHNSDKERWHPSFLDVIDDKNIPTHFDARTQWPKCKKTINHIRDQGACGSCWAVSTASAFTDELCVANKLKNGQQIASEDILACTFYGNCNGGMLPLAWFHIKHTGAVTGGDYDSSQGCLPYAFQPCEHHAKGQRPQCSTLTVKSPSCPSQCSNPHYSVSFDKDKHFVKDYSLLKGETDMKKAILANGPIVTGFTVYEDFLTYKNGVYHHVTGKELGGHAVKIIGWGVEKKTPYWLVANSWNTDWGNKGFFKILRGKNECDFENNGVTGIC